ncbi:MAG: carbon-nitrogen hydrolase family protein [Pseudomonadota bacterium]
MRVAALQFASGTEVEANLQTCLRMIRQAGQVNPDLMVLPEFCNHISWYDDHEHARRVSLDLEGEFLEAIANEARAQACYLVINVSLRRVLDLTVSSILFGPDGRRLAVADKQTLMGHENTWFSRADEYSEVIATPQADIAMFPCRDGVTCETPRGLALLGAQVFCDSLNSFALDEATLHVPARAPENQCFLVAANKVGPLIPEHLLEAVASETHIPLKFLYGAGESQVVSPEGEIIARGPRGEEAVVWADIEPARARDKTRPDGTELFAVRRPELYAPLIADTEPDYIGDAAAEAGVALLRPLQRGEQGLDELAALVAELPTETRLAVLPELFCHREIVGEIAPQDLEQGKQALEAMRAACTGRPELLLCASLVRPLGSGAALTVVLVGQAGLVASQPVIHFAERYRWSRLGDQLKPVDLPWGRVALLAGDDAVHPEWVKCAALAGCHLIAAPLDVQASWEIEYGLPSRAAENRVCIAASSFDRHGCAGLIATLERDFTIMTEWQERQFDGFINQPLLTAQSGQITCASTHPQAACNKLMSAQTDLLLDRPRTLSTRLVENHSHELP